LKGSYSQSSTGNFKLGSAFVVAADGTISKTSNTGIAIDVATCTATNVLKSLDYRVVYDDAANGSYTIRDIYVDMLLLKELKLDPKYCQDISAKNFYSYE